MTRKTVCNIIVAQLVRTQDGICLKRLDLTVTHDCELLHNIFPAYCPLLMLKQLTRCSTAVLLQQPYCTGMTQWRTQEFCSGGGVSTNSVEDRGQRERGSGGSSPLVRGSEGSCNLVQEISYSKIFLIFCYFKTIYDDNQFICHC